jgi:3-isopropylmalate/(R)-2-methylmalate dehydratase large subunit
MKKSFIERIAGVPAGATVTIKPDLVIINDGVSSGVIDLVSKVAEPGRIIVMYDHDVPTGSSEAASVFIKINQFAKKYGILFVQGKGLGYQYLLHETVKPGQIIIGGGSHCSIFGSLQALGINTDIKTLADVIEKGTYTFKVPETLTVSLEGKPPANTDTMDVGFHFLAEIKILRVRSLNLTANTLFPIP